MNIANKLTTLRLILIPVLALLMVFLPENSWIPLIVFCVAAITDFFDGYFARKYNLVTTFGEFVDPLADKMLTITAYSFLIPRIPVWVVWVVVMREITISGFRILAASEGVNIAASVWGKAKTVTQFITIILYLMNPNFLTKIPFPIAKFFLYLSTLLTIFSLVDYIWKSRHVLNLENI